jgi:hypothetical protein
MDSFGPIAAFAMEMTASSSKIYRIADGLQGTRQHVEVVDPAEMALKSGKPSRGLRPETDWFHLE